MRLATGSSLAPLAADRGAGCPAASFDAREGTMDDRTMRDRAAANELEGTGDALKGRVKDAAGGLTGNTGMQREGKLDQLEGKARDVLGDVQRKLGGARRHDRS